VATILREGYSQTEYISTGKVPQQELAGTVKFTSSHCCCILS